MKKKKIISTIIASALIIPAFFGLTACKSKKKEPIINARDVYAMSALSSVAYLSENSSALQTSLNNFEMQSASYMTATERPSTLSDSDVTGIYNCLSMFDDVVLGGGFDQSIKNNTSSDNILKDYTFEMNISLATGSGNSEICTMYFDEIDSKTETKLDDGEKEIEVNTRFEGVIVYGTEKFVVNGKREFEVEGKETESSIEFKTYRNSSQTGIVADTNNYVVIEQSLESDEIEYEYTFFKNGQKVQDIELEYEQEKSGVEIEFRLKDISSDVLNQTIFKIKKGTNPNEFVVIFSKNKQNDTIKITKLENNSYTFTYSNEFTETFS